MWKRYFFHFVYLNCLFCQFLQLPSRDSQSYTSILNVLSLPIHQFEAETPTLGPWDAKNWLIWKDPDAGRDWRWEEKEMTESEVVGWHHWLNGHEFESTPGAGDGQGGLACCGPWDCKESNTTERLNWLVHQMQSVMPFFSWIYRIKLFVI